MKMIDEQLEKRLDFVIILVARRCRSTTIGVSPMPSLLVLVMPLER